MYRGIRIKTPPLDPDQPNFSIWAGGFLIHISNSPKLARGVFISYRSVLDLFLTVFPLENRILGVQKPNFFSPAAGSNSGNSPKLEGVFNSYFKFSKVDLGWFLTRGGF